MKWKVRDSSWDSVYCPEEKPTDGSIDKKILVKFADGTIAEWSVWDMSNSWEEGGSIVAYAVIED